MGWCGGPYFGKAAGGCGQFAYGGKGAQPRPSSAHDRFAPVSNAFQGGKSAKPTRKAVSGGAAAYLGTWCEGSFKSFNATKGWGFLNSPNFGEDVFISFNTAPELRTLFGENPSKLDGTPVTFLLAESGKNPGTFEAQNVSLGGGKGGAARSAGKSQPQRRQAAPAPAAYDGVPCEG